jgi:hypothetical protein
MTEWKAANLNAIPTVYINMLLIPSLAFPLVVITHSIAFRIFSQGWLVSWGCRNSRCKHERISNDGLKPLHATVERACIHRSVVILMSTKAIGRRIQEAFSAFIAGMRWQWMRQGSSFFILAPINDCMWMALLNMSSHKRRKVFRTSFNAFRGMGAAVSYNSSMWWLGNEHKKCTCPWEKHLRRIAFF